jgi:Spy/CpxP family protein refolding chaperone
MSISETMDFLNEMADSLEAQDAARDEMYESMKREIHENHECKKREQDALQAIVETLQMQKEALRVQVEVLLVQKETLAAQKWATWWNSIVTVFAVLLGSALTLFVQWLKS